MESWNVKCQHNKNGLKQKLYFLLLNILELFRQDFTLILSNRNAAKINCEAYINTIRKR